MTDNPRDEVTLTKSSSVGVSGSASDEARRPPETVSILWCPVCGQDDRWRTFGRKYHSSGGERCSGTPTELVYESRLVGLSADVSRLTAEKNEWMAKWERERVEREALEASLRDAGDAKP